VLETNARVKPITEPDRDMRIVSLQGMPKCKTEMKGEDIWLGDSTSKSRK